MLECNVCGEVYENISDIMDIDENKGFWCDNCDGYTYFDKEQSEKHKFTLILEDKSKNESTILKKSNIKFNKRLSPLRYAGGKSKLIDYLYNKMQNDKLENFVEPYCGGASVGLALLEAGVIKNLTLNDLDFGVYSLFKVIKENPNELIQLIKTEPLNHSVYFKAQTTMKNNYKNCTSLQAAWATLIVNRLSYSGIHKANPLGGKNGSIKSLLSRWNSDNIINRINKVHSLRNNIEILNIDACELIEEMYWVDNTTIFIDPPYFKKGEILYNKFYTKENHEQLSVLLDSLHTGMPIADILVTYDNAKYIETLYQSPIIEYLNRTYSI